MPICQTQYLGAISFDWDAVIVIQDGLFGFPHDTRFLPIEFPSTRPVVFLQSLDTPELCFICVPVNVVDPAYGFRARQEDAAALGGELRGRQDVLWLSILTIPEAGESTANLRAPVVIDFATRHGRQLIVEGDYSCEHPFSDALTHARSAVAC